MNSGGKFTDVDLTDALHSDIQRVQDALAQNEVSADTPAPGTLFDSRWEGPGILESKGQ